MGGYGILRMTKVANWGAVDRLGAHHLRTTGYTAKSNPDIDTARTASNYRLDDAGDGDLKSRVEARIAAGLTATNKDGTAKKLRADAVKMVDIVCAASGDFMAGLTADRQREYFKDCLDWIKGRFGAANVVSAVVHMDETTPHLHVCVVPITEKGRLSAKEFMDGRAKLRGIQDGYWAGVSRKWGLERGEKVELTKRAHLNVADFKASTDKIRVRLEQEQASLEAERVRLEQVRVTEMNALRAEIGKERARLEAETAQKLEKTETKIKELEGRLTETNEDYLQWLDKVEEEIDVKPLKPQNSGMFAKPVQMAILPVERMTEMKAVMEAKIYEVVKNQERIAKLEKTVKEKQKTIEDMLKNYTPNDVLRAAGLTPEAVRNRAVEKTEEKQRQKELTKGKPTGFDITD